MNICMVGAGYVGLVSAACLAEFGWTIACVDKDPGRLDALRRGEIPIYEPGLEDLIKRHVGAGRLRFVSELPEAVASADVVLLAVGTPMRRGDGHADLSYVFAAVDELAPYLTGFTVVSTKSTVPVGTSRQVEERIRRLRPDADIAVCSNPEFLREGSAIQDFMHPDRVLVGCDDPRARETMFRLYKPLTLRNTPVMFVGRESAELAKYAANAFLAMKISFINEMADLCEHVGADVQEVANAIGRDRRIGDKFLHPGPGYGGSCFPKDTLALIKTAQDYEAPMRIVETVAAVNSQRKRAMGRKVIAACGGSVRGKTVAVLGLTFKPNTDDMRDAPSIDVITALQDAGARIKAYDPEGMGAAEAVLTDVDYAKDPYDCARDADALVLVTEWDAFRALDLRRLKAALAAPVVVDLRNVYRPEEMRRHGFTYVSIGRT